MDKAGITIHFPDVTPDLGNVYAEDLRASLEESLEAGGRVERRRSNLESQDFGATVVLILGTSAVVNSSSTQLPTTDRLDAMRLNWGPYLWMRCYMNGAGIVNQIVGSNPNWASLEEQARKVAPRCGGISVSPFLSPEPSLGVVNKHFKWNPKLPREPKNKSCLC